jgi:hypothetical protein
LNAPANRATTPAIELEGRDEEGISASARDLVADQFRGQVVDPRMSCAQALRAALGESGFVEGQCCAALSPIGPERT